MNERSKWDDLNRHEHGHKGEYNQTCPWCQETHSLLTQRDEYPDCYTDITIKCGCGEAIKFKLPVN